MLKGSKHKLRIRKKIKARMLLGKQGFKKTTFKKGHKPLNPWWEDSKKVKEASERMRQMRKKYPSAWNKGLINSLARVRKAKNYRIIHQWLQDKYGKAKKCESHKCKKESFQYEWALLKNKNYDFKRKNFKQLCKKCHHLYDKDFKILKCNNLL